MKSITATNARSNFFQLLKNILKSRLPMRIFSKEGNVVVISEEEYESLIETAELLSISGLKESIKESDVDIASGNIYSLDDVFKD